MELAGIKTAGDFKNEQETTGVEHGSSAVNWTGVVREKVKGGGRNYNQSCETKPCELNTKRKQNLKNLTVLLCADTQINSVTSLTPGPNCFSYK